MPDRIGSPAPDKPFLERVGVGYLERLASGAPLPPAIDAVHVLNDDELAALRAITTGAIVRAAVVGGLSALSSALAAIYATPLLGALPDTASIGAQGRYWLVVGGVTAVASVLEIGFLYWDALRSVHRLAAAAGLRVTDGPGSADHEVAAALARAALELPNPPDHLLGVDPLREASKPMLALVSLLYKLKVALTTFVMKALVRSALGRMAVRAALELVAVPVNAAWNAGVCALVMREARLRAMGPSAAAELTGWALGDPTALSDQARSAALGAVGSAIVRTRDLHPNLRALLRVVARQVGLDHANGWDEPGRFMRGLGELSRPERGVVLRVLSLAAIIDGKLTGPERRLLREAFAAASEPLDERAVEALRRAFVSGRPIPPDHVRAIARHEPSDEPPASAA